MRDPGDLGDRHRPVRPVYRTALAARLGWVALQQMRADPAQLGAQDAAGARHRAARHHHAARGEGAEAERRALGVAVAHRDARRIDAEFLAGDLRQGGLQPLAVRLDADHQHHAAVGQDARGAALETGDDRGAARGEFGGAVRGLLGEAGEADADQPPVRLAAVAAVRGSRGRFSSSAQSRTLAG